MAKHNKINVFVLFASRHAKRNIEFKTPYNGASFFFFLVHINMATIIMFIYLSTFFCITKDTRLKHVLNSIERKREKKFDSFFSVVLNGGKQQLGLRFGSCFFPLCFERYTNIKRSNDELTSTYYRIKSETAMLQNCLCVCVYLVSFQKE